MKFIEIKLTKYLLYFTEAELASLLAKDRTLWVEAIKRGKAFARAANSRPAKPQKKEDFLK